MTATDRSKQSAQPAESREPSARVTLRHLAEELGLSQQAVSLALRNAKGVSEATRARVKKRAAELGYTPDAGLQALVAYRTNKKQVSSRWDQVAVLHNWPDKESLFRNRFYGQWYRELEAAASARGIQLLPHWVGPKGERTQAVFRTLRNCGITGMFLAPPAMTEDPPPVNIPRGAFQIVTFGPEHLYPDLHTIQFDFYENLRLAWQVLWDRGHRRIGLVYGKQQGWRTGHAWRAAFHVEKLLSGCPPGVRMPLELSGPEASHRRQYDAWLREGDYDAVISSVRWIGDTAAGGGRSPEIALFNVLDSGQQGIDLNLPQMARSAVELLLMEMHRSLVQEQSLPLRVHIPGRWVEAL